jgi:hypothetical protein
VALSNGVVPGRETVRAIARRARALAAVNGGYFGSSGLFEGDPSGALAIRGRLISEPDGGRASLILPPPPARARVANLWFAGSVSINGGRRELDGINRARGPIAFCARAAARGGLGQAFAAASACSDASELVMYTRRFGRRTRTSSRGVEAVVSHGVITSLRYGGNSRIPKGGYVLSGSGDAASFLKAVAAPGARPAVDPTMQADSRLLRRGSYQSIVGGGPSLVRAGRARVRAAAEGFTPIFAARNPRTLAGVRPNGQVLLVTIDGRNRRWSVGVTLWQAARVMRALGARNALNLDGGGSTTMVVGRRVVNRPSDGAPRRVSDALLVLRP